MIKKLNIICLAVAVCFASCQKDPSADQMSDTNKVSFSAESISSLTRVTNNEWDAGDAIGITMLKSSNQTVLYDNIKYLAAESAASVSLTPDSETIYYSEDGEGVDFIAFYPYDEEWSFETGDAVFDISTQDGTQDEQDKIDLLSSKNLTNQTSGTQIFQFGHALAKVQITVSNYHELSAFEDLGSLTATLYTDYVQYNVANDTRVSSSETQELKMVQASYDEATDEAVFTVIITPSADAVSDRIIFTDGVNDYEATLALTSIDAGKQYNFSAVVGDRGITYVELTADGSISWDVQTDVSLSKDIELQGDTYMIYTAAGLKLFATLVNSGKTSLNGCLMNDINLDGSETNQWTPIGWYTSSTDYCAYSGSFDGGGYEVKGLYINNSSSYQGLFGYTYSANISNLGVSGDITAGSCVGGIVGYCNGTSDNHNVITECYNNATVSGTSSVGGIAGATQYSEMDWCYNTGELSSGSSHIGGIVGESFYSFIESCYNTGTITSKGSYAGGIAGWFRGDYWSNGDINIVNNCYNTGDVSAVSSNYVGGIAGYIFKEVHVSNSYNTAKVTGVEHVGGVIGFSSAARATNENYIGNCYNTGVVDGTSNAGGVVGYASFIYATNCSYDSSTYSNGSAIGTTYVNAYPTNVVGVSGLSSAMTNGTFATFLNGVQDSAPWAEDTDKSNGSYPVLQTPVSFNPSATTYKIHTAYEFTLFAGYVNDGYVSINGELCADIELGCTEDDPWTPIGTGESSTAGYGGTFNGGGYSITGLYINASAIGQGLFAYIYNGTVTNLSVGGSVTNADYHTALIAGDAINATFISCSTLEGSTVTCTANNNTAGIAGYVVGASFEDCHNNATVTGTKHVGGIVGYSGNSAVTFTNCSNTGKISSSGINTGGIIGRMLGSSSNVSYLLNCANSGNISSTDQYVGGLVADNQGGAIYNSYNRGDVSSSSSNVGGLVGINQDYSNYGAVIRNCYTTGSVSGSSNVGLAVGNNDASTITNCYATSSTSAIGTDNNSQSVAAYTLSSLVSTLNSNLPSITGVSTWVTGSDSYPTFSFLTE